MSTAIPVLLFLHCSFLVGFKRWLGPLGTFYGALTVLGLIICISCWDFIVILRDNYFLFLDFGRWFFCVDLIDSHIVFCFDTLALTGVLVVATLTSVALYFGVEYMYREAFLTRLLYLLNLFATSVIFLFIAYDFFLILVAWEGIGLFSLLLVNFYATRIYTLKAALKTFIFSRISDMCLFTAFLIILALFHTSDLGSIFAQLPFYLFHFYTIGAYSCHALSILGFLIVLSGVIKAAQFFFHVWLPDAMEAPTPASALIHSSTLVVAGVFLILRFTLLFEFTPLVNYFLAILGGSTLVFASVTATFQHDIKKLVAYSTISQIGYLVCGCGFCCYAEVLLYLIIHAFNKAFLFILVGYLVHFFNGNTDMRQMGGAYMYAFDITVLLFGIAMNLTGLPYSAGFLAKEFLLFQLWRDELITLYVRACWYVSFFFTPIYMGLLIVAVHFTFKRAAQSLYAPLWRARPHQLAALQPNTPFLVTNYFQLTFLTARSTTAILLFGWLCFFFVGELFLLFLFNFSTAGLNLVNSYFFITSTEEPWLTTQPVNPGQQLSYYLFMLLGWAGLWLTNIQRWNSYNMARYLSFFLYPVPFLLWHCL